MLRHVETTYFWCFTYFFTLEIYRLPLKKAQCVSATMSRVQDLAPQHIANVVWAMAKMSASSAEQCGAFARPAWEAQQQFKPQEACNLLWAFAATTVHVRDAQMANTVAALSTQLLKQLGRCNPQDHANFMWAAVILSAADRIQFSLYRPEAGLSFMHLADQVTQSAVSACFRSWRRLVSAVVWAVSKGTFHELIPQPTKPSRGSSTPPEPGWQRNIEAMGLRLRALWVPGLLAKGIALAAEFRTQELTGALLFRADELASVAASVARLSQDTKVLKQLFFQSQPGCEAFTESSLSVFINPFVPSVTMGSDGKGKGKGWGMPYNFMTMMKVMMAKGKGKGKQYRVPADKKVWIGGWPAESTSVETNKKLKEHMCQAGECIWAEVGWKGEGHAVFKTPEECQNAIAMLNGSMFEGHTLQVDVWTKKDPTPAA
ncbi:unnamed protein product [Symbiodinium necroappetens]|uniref:RRM domain-containing protein n=1 Tax=Symbiodinium necroappetens TaxID=1628268 RepID=A0A813A7R4_9DINO|nr:unnamed protein product [Symbiodinium necroappetens]